MSQRVYQILYCSRNKMCGSDAERKVQIERILRSSRMNNARVGVTGALFYNTVFFAQVLEGSFADVQRVFERLQLDARHSDLVVLQSGFTSKRDFGDWSMAFAGASAAIELPLIAGTSSAHTQSGALILSFLRDVVVKQESWALPQRPSAVRLSVTAHAVLAS